MSTRSAAPFGRLVHLLASLRVGVVTMVVLAATCGIATFYESSHGTAAAQRTFYQTGWFTALLALLALNILLSMLRRYPWSRHQAGFVMAHVGIVLLLVGSLVSLHGGLDGTVALHEGDGTDVVTLRERVLSVQVGARKETFAADFDSRPPRPDRPARFPVSGTPVTVVVEDYAPHAEVGEVVEAADGGPPALAFALDGGFGHYGGWLLAGGERAEAELGPLRIRLRAAASEAEARGALAASEPGSQIAFVVGPGESVRYALHGKKTAAAAGAVIVGSPIATPWMGLHVTVEKVLPRAAVRQVVRPVDSPPREERSAPAVRVRFDSPGHRTAPEWVPWQGRFDVHLEEGHAFVSFAEREVPLPFRVTLLDFRAETYPGSRRPASYESRVRVEEMGGSTSEHLISMNHPLHRQGYVFFQASFVEGQPMMSILSVSRSPGLPLVYLGTALVSVGLAWMFYVKPWLVRRQVRRAARRAAWTSEVVEVTP
jgi:hypothetical protein